MTLTTTRAAFDQAAATNPIVSVCREVFADSDTPASIYRKVAASRPGTFLLESAEQGGVWTRFSFVGAGSFGVLSERDGRAYWAASPESAMTEERLLPGGVVSLEPLEAVQAAYERWKADQVDGLPPLTSGFVGYIGWDTIRQIETTLPDPGFGPAAVPVQGLSFVSELIVIDHREGSVILIANVLTDEEGVPLDNAWDDAQARLDGLQRSLAASAAAPVATLNREAVTEAKRVTPQAEYLRLAQLTIDRIREGEAGQVVVSQRFDSECTADPLDVYRVLRHLNPSPYLYLLSYEGHDGEPFSVVGSSPEALITVNGGRVITHPIGGSKPRGTDASHDLQLEKELLADKKERTEHEMLVDLSKRDLSTFCVPESVHVSDLMRIERYSHVMHIVSTVEGELRPEESPVSALRATFPAGTLSGDPKPKALAIIDELETASRGVYGGVVGYFGLGGDADLAIAIRTATIRSGIATVQAGGGIVADSVPASEDEECRNKAAAPLRAVAIANTLVEEK
ncbi:chorismate-binding protein [Leucobacter sp. UCMA 4100]|uniref:chorismate-binding protein n=1 Tax=Leucobacter sp. UCMA 4100 TaxID=2810534 RepID=UPI0022EA9240|nr:chorismate-binding protein [Leucobacter sp. UCMA 4100]MDA3148137.1 chorismate-binding protein [Leucobacter sp. UCMA 4100]